MKNLTNRVKAGLLLPVNYVPGHRYPLVIQTHGYEAERFLSSGESVPFAARTLAASGIAVMQVPMCLRRTRDGISTYPDLIPCEVRIYKAAIRYAVANGFADPRKVGIIGFSATCEPVLAALEGHGLHFAAAELVDGLMNTYTQFVDNVDEMDGWVNEFETPSTGGPPFGVGLMWWVSHSPGFSIAKIKTPVLIQASGRDGVLVMWEPYAVLHYLQRPVELIVVQEGTHPVINPLQQLAAQGLGVDWFRFWLKNERPASGAEYQRWSKLRRASN